MKEKDTEIIIQSLRKARGSRKSNASFAYKEKGSDEILYRPAEACYAEVNYSKHALVLFFGLFLRKDDRRDAEIAFLSWMLDPSASPWRQLLPFADNRMNDPEWVWNNGFLIHGPDLDHYTMLLQSFLQAGRFTHEMPGSLLIWKELVDKGVPKALAFVACVFLDRTEEGLERSFDNNLNHFPIAPTTLEELVNFSNGVFTHRTDKTFATNTCRDGGLDTMWRVGDRRRSAGCRMPDELAALGRRVTKQGTFGPFDVAVIDFDRVVEYLFNLERRCNDRTEQERARTAGSF